MPAPRNYTTTISVDVTLGEIQKILGSHGANRVSVDYDAQGDPSGVGFMLSTPHGPRHFTLPVDVDAMARLVAKEVDAGRISGSKSKVAWKSREHAAKVAWRVVKDWIDAQMTMVAAQQATLAQVMLPYLEVDDDGRTLYDAYREREAGVEQRMLEAR